MKKLLFLFVFAFLFACSDDDENVIAEATKYRPTIIKHYDGDGVLHGTETFQYNSDNQLIYHDNSSWRNVELTYENGKLATLSFLYSDPDDNFTYQVNHQDRKIELYVEGNEGNVGVWEFNDERLITRRYSLNEENPDELISLKEYHYKPGGYIDFIDRGYDSVYFYTNVEVDTKNITFGSHSGAYGTGISHYLDLYYGKGLSTKYVAHLAPFTPEVIEAYAEWFAYEFDDQNRVTAYDVWVWSDNPGRTVIEY